MSGYKFEIDTSQCVKRFEPQYAKAQKVLDSEVLRCSNKYVPFRSGNLRDSGISGTVLGSGKVIYNAPYAKKQYYALNYHHAQGCALWFEKAKAVHKGDWLNTANAVVRGEQ